MRPALITGGGGQLASDLAELLAGRPRRARPERARHQRRRGRRAHVRGVSPELVFNCAAFHNVEVCERSRTRAFAVNARAVGPASAARRPARARAPVHELRLRRPQPAPYAEHDLPIPRSVYALSKLAGEYAALAYAPGASSCAQPACMASPAARRRAATSSRGWSPAPARAAPSSGWSRTNGSADLHGRSRRRLVDGVEREATGMVHLTSSGDCSWHEFTVAIMRLARPRRRGRGGRHVDRAGRRRPPAERRARPPARGRARASAAASLARGARGLHAARRPCGRRSAS